MVHDFRYRLPGAIMTMRPAVIVSLSAGVLMDTMSALLWRYDARLHS
ncbi:MAG TPA: hypothetical protein VEP29_06785 [Desulfatiglandales bacterium]|nr:hypothetical protein [Desulfatiglandales bacterium]